MAKNLDELNLKYEELKLIHMRLTTLLKLATSYGKTKVSLLKSKYSIALSIREEISALEKEALRLNSKVPEEKRIDFAKGIGNCDELIEAIDVLYSEAFNLYAKPEKSGNPERTTSVVKPSALNLPSIVIKPFQNDILDFSRFIRLFTAVYDSHPSLSGAEKFSNPVCVTRRCPSLTLSL